MRYWGDNKVELLDPSQLLRPEFPLEKAPNAFRDYSLDDSDPIKRRVKETYRQMHTYQTYDFVQGQHVKWLKFDTFRSTVKDALIKLNDLIDESDPDVDIPNIVHAFQTAERIREDYPDLDWFHLTGLVHDLGKVMAFYDEPQWAVVGDTFVVGCEWPKNIVYRDTSFVDNPDAANSLYNTKHGVYQPNCGLDNVTMSWGHDEYLYQVLVHNGTTLPLQALYMIRYHSFYPWHSGDEYAHLSDERDEEMKKWVLLFNKYDLYTKSATIPNIKKLWPYYEGLIAKYMPGILKW